MLCYLNDVAPGAGGATVFPEQTRVGSAEKLAVAPSRGACSRSSRARSGRTDAGRS